MKTAKRILQVFQNFTTYGQKENTHAQRLSLTRWNDPLAAFSGYAEKDCFILSDELLEQGSGFESCNTVILNDCNDASTRQRRRTLAADQSGAYTLLQLCHHPQKYNIFTLYWTDDGFELALDYSRNSTWIGKPARADYKLANLKVNQPVRVTINGKHDFSLSGRRARTFLVADYVFVYQGEYSRFELKPEVASQKRVPLAAAKHVDLRVILR